MNGIDRLRAVTEWANSQPEAFWRDNPPPTLCQIAEVYDLVCSLDVATTGDALEEIERDPNGAPMLAKLSEVFPWVVETERGAS